jgi:hypothetical protein
VTFNVKQQTGSKSSKWVVTAMAIAWCLPVWADLYQCRVNDVQAVADSGQLGAADTFYRHFVGSEFRVDRKTGEIKGAVFDNRKADKVVLLNRGTSDQPFMVLSVWPGRTSASFIQIADYVTAADKPLLAMEGSHVYTGLCQGVAKKKDKP